MTRQIVYTPSGVDLTVNNRAFIGGTSSPAVSGQNSRIQLFNPVGSGVRVVVIRFRARSAGGDSTVVRPTTTPLTTLTTDTFNKLVGPTTVVPKAEIRFDSVPNSGGGSKQEGILEIITAASPAVLEAGFGINLEGEIKNTEVGALFEWIELQSGE